MSYASRWPPRWRPGGRRSIGSPPTSIPCSIGSTSIPPVSGAAAVAGAASESALASRPPWERPDGDGHPGNGAARDPEDANAASSPAWQDTGADGPANGQTSGPAAWQPWQPTAAPLAEASPVTTSRPPWEDATLDGRGAAAVDPVTYVPAGPAATLTTAFAKAAGVPAVTETLNGVRERSAAGYIGWPPARLAGRLRGQPPARKATATDAGDTAQAQRSDIDNAITAFADEVAGSLPDEAQAVLGVAVVGGLPPRDKVTGWWRLVALAQWLLMALSLVGVVWIVVILATHGGHKSSLVSDVSLAPWLGVMVVALLV